MPKPKVYSSSLLSIEVSADEDTITAEWKGKSIEREPHKFITPILTREIRRCSEQNKRLVLDFRHLEYMNSSTITPIIKILERAKRGTTHITVRHDKSLKWQELIFSALMIFKTADNRVEIVG